MRRELDPILGSVLMAVDVATMPIRNILRQANDVSTAYSPVYGHLNGLQAATAGSSLWSLGRRAVCS